jgi:hypothetical protein
MNGFYVYINRATIEVTEFQSHLDIVIEDLSLGWSRRQSYQHVTCAKVDLSNPLGTVGFSRVRVSRLSAFIRSRKEPSTIRTSDTFYYAESVTLLRHEVNDKPTRLTLVVMTQEQDKAEGATPHVFSVTDGFQPN